LPGQAVAIRRRLRQLSREPLPIVRELPGAIPERYVVLLLGVAPRRLGLGKGKLEIGVRCPFQAELTVQSRRLFDRLRQTAIDCPARRIRVGNPKHHRSELRGQLGFAPRQLLLSLVPRSLRLVARPLEIGAGLALVTDLAATRPRESPLLSPPGARESRGRRRPAPRFRRHSRAPRLPWLALTSASAALNSASLAARRSTSAALDS
jgi:hypothetical protein